MKKFIKRALISATILCGGMTVTSCDSDTIAEIASLVITNLIGQNGKVYNYVGKGTTQLLSVPNTDGQYTKQSTSASFSGTIQLQVNNTTANMVIPTMTVGGYTVSQITFSNLVLTAGTSSTSVGLGDNSSADGTITVDGTSYSVSNLYTETSITSTTMTTTTMSIYFGENNEYVINLTFSGTASTTE